MVLDQTRQTLAHERVYAYTYAREKLHKPMPKNFIMPPPPSVSWVVLESPVSAEVSAAMVVFFLPGKLLFTLINL